MAKNLIIILGATASGKTQLAVRLAHELTGEIISADSRQVYKGLDIGTGKDLKEYVIDGRSIPYHLIDIISAEKEFNLFEFQTCFFDIYSTLVQKNVIPILVGGTGLYIESVIKNYHLPSAPPDEELRRDLQMKSISDLQEYLAALKVNLHNKTDIETKDRLIRAIEIARARQKDTVGKLKRTAINAAVFGIHWDRLLLRQRITVRLKQRLREGLIDEVKALQTAGLSWDRLESFGLEYRYVSQYLLGKINYQEMFDKLNTSIHQYAKRQETWFRRMERKGIMINWVNGDDYGLLKEMAVKYLHD